MQRIGLYYPYIHFRDDNWLKAAALYWPQIARIVPTGYEKRDTATTRELADGLGFVLDVPPNGPATAVAGVFREVLRREAERLRETYGVYEDDLRALLGHARDRGRPETWCEPTARELKPLAGVYWDEVDPGLREELVGAGLAVHAERVRVGTAQDRNGPWLAMHPRLAWAYKCALTERCARSNGLEPVTDGVDTHAMAGHWNADRIIEVLLEGGDPPAPAENADPAARVGLMAVSLVLPADLAGVPAERVVALRRRHADEFDAFRDAVSEAVREVVMALPQETDPVVLDAYLRQVVARRFERPLADLRTAMRGLSLNTVMTAVGTRVELPAAVTALGGGVLAGQPALAGAGGLAFGLLGVARSLHRGRRGLAESTPAAYLLRVEDGLAPHTLLRRVAARTRSAGDGT